MNPKIRFTVTPPIIIIRRCQAGLLLNSQGCAGFAICSLSILSSIIPAIFTYPPKGSHPIPYTVSPIFFLKRANLTSKKRKNFSTLVLNNFAGIKCPNSCSITKKDKLRMSCPALIKNVSIT